MNTTPISVFSVALVGLLLIALAHFAGDVRAHLDNLSGSTQTVTTNQVEGGK